MKYRGLIIVGTISLLIFSACGTTVSKSEQRRILTQSNGGLSGAGIPEPGEPTTAQPGAAPQPGAAAAGGQAPVTRNTVKSATGATVVTESEVKVGILYVKDAGAGNAAAGFVGIGQLDSKRSWDAVIADINKSPIAGRKVVPIYREITTDELNAKGTDRVAQETCAYFTQEKPVFTYWLGGTDALRNCFTKAKVSQLASAGGNSYSKTFQDYPYYVEPNGPGLDRMAKFYVDELMAKNFFFTFRDDVGSPPHPDNQPKIALVRYNEPAYKAGAAAIKQQLAKHNLALCDGCEFEIVRGQNANEQLNEANQVNAAVDNCKSKGCTHILFEDSLAGVRITLFWSQRAENQIYRPRLGLTSLNAPVLVANLLGPGVARGVFGKSVVVGWKPLLDAFHETPEHKRCIKLLQDAGETFGDPATPHGTRTARRTRIATWLGTTKRH